MENYPAAHSMDTEWFAVDADGNVGYFHSGEEGAVPKFSKPYPISRMISPKLLFAAMAQNNPDRLLKVDARGNKIAKSLNLRNLQESIGWSLGYFENHCHKKSKYIPSIFDFFLLLASEDVIPLLEIGTIDNNCIIHLQGESTLVFVRECHVSTLQPLIESKQVLGGRNFYDYRYLMTLLGFFYYYHESYEISPYRRFIDTINPLKQKDLSPLIQQDDIHWIYFNNVKFSESRKVQPIEHVPCNTWGNDKNWIDIQGNEHKTHPY